MKKPKTLAELRAAAYAAVAAHEADMQNKPEYKAAVEQHQAKQEAKAIKAGKRPIIRVGQKWKTNGGEVAAVMEIKEGAHAPVRVSIAGRPFLNLLAADGSDVDMGVNARDALATLISDAAPVQVEIRGVLLDEVKEMTVQFGRTRSEVMSFNEAAAVYRAYIESKDIGASKAPACIVKIDGNTVATISYNGRVWNA